MMCTELYIFDLDFQGQTCSRVLDGVVPERFVKGLGDGQVSWILKSLRVASC